MTRRTFHCDREPVGALEHGMGYNWYDGYEPREPDGTPIFPDIDDGPAWDKLMGGLDELKPGFIRFGFPADTVVGEKTGTIAKDSVHFRRLQLVADWAQENGCCILLDSWSIPRRYRFPEPPDLKETQGQWAAMAAADNRAYAEEFVVPLLKHVVEDLGLSAVKLFNPYNEPLIYGPFVTPDNRPDKYVHYVDMFKEMHEALTRAGLRPGKIKLAGVDCIHADTFPALEMLARGVDIDPYLDCYTIHFYFHRFDWMNPVPFLAHALGESLDKQTLRVREYCSRRGKPLLAAEVGWYPNDGDPVPTDEGGSARHFAALVTAESIVRGMNAGLTGFAIWGLLNPNDRDGQWRIMGILDGELWKAPNLFPTYRLLSRHARPGSRVHPLRPESPATPWEHVHACLLHRPDDKVVIYVVNDNLVETAPVRLGFPEQWAGRRFRKFVKDEVRRGDGVETIDSVRREDLGCIEDTLMPMSLTAYVEE